ncbi:MAG TPA: hypothetical protein VHU83_18560 [Bryobacteraceae bacterium]|jgi:Spy/CpxP family protein refolding chaperone|nr:hypothetical protein [Bryobacteraceae bacterium]
MRRNQWTAALLAVLLFGCGILVGALGERFYAASSVSAKTAEDFRHHYISEMESRLKLTPAQVSQLETILDDTKAKYKAIRDASHPAMLKIKNEQIARVKSILTPQQVPAYEQLVTEREQRARQQEERERADDQKRAAARESRNAK